MSEAQRNPPVQKTEKGFFGCGPKLEIKDKNGKVIENRYLWSCLTNKDFLIESQNKEIMQKSHDSLVRILDHMNAQSQDQ